MPKPACHLTSTSGVKVRAIIRGMCSLRPGIPGLSDNIHITSIVDRFLEHPRVMIFCNNNQEELYISSADWMTRNLDYRIEVGAPVLDPELRERIRTIFKIQESDNQKARIIDADQKNAYVAHVEGAPKIRSQIEILSYLQAVEQKHNALISATLATAEEAAAATAAATAAEAAAESEAEEKESKKDKKKDKKDKKDKK